MVRPRGRRVRPLSRLILAGQVLAAAVVVIALVTVVFLKATSPYSGTVALYDRDEFQARRGQRPGTPGH
jgi:hypothetical protein